ncbi:MAG: hypothetical protein ATN31_02155 [Candidatus Epulonipiscioides saccharophilum]|nr:MAG: hypothetical protein ATN31_02155 [Epulopiscium sp. AS2M-Bin001]
MKLRQKFAMILAAATVSSTIPVTTHALAGGADVIKTSMTTKAGYNSYGYHQDHLGDLYPQQNRAINIGIKNHTDRYPKYVNQLPAVVDITGKDIAFDERLFPETKKDLTDLPDWIVEDNGEGQYGDDKNDDNNSYTLQYNTIFETKAIQENNPEYRKNIIPLNDYEYHYAMPDKSQYNDRAYASKLTESSEGATSGDESDPRDLLYPHRIYTIDNEGNYTSFVSIEYAGNSFKKYLSKLDAVSDDDYDMDVYLFGLATKDINNDKDTIDDNEMIFLNLLKDPNGTSDNTAGLNRTKLIINNELPKIFGKYGDVIGDLEYYNYFDDDAKSIGTRLYVKEYTLYRDQYGDDKSLEMLLFQRVSPGNNFAERLFVPLAFRVTGAKPSVKVGDEFGLFTINWDIPLYSNTTVNDSFVDINLDSLGYMSTDGKGRLGSFKIEENINFIFNGNFVTTNDPEEDFEKYSAGGRTYHITLSDKDVLFDDILKTGDRYWDVAPKYNDAGELEDEGELGKLANYIKFTGGLRGFEDYIQVELLGIEDNELVIRIIDESILAPIVRKYEGGLQFTNLPFEVDKRDELNIGNLAITIEEVDDIRFVEKDGKVDKVSFNSANSIEETFNIAKISADNFIIGLESKVDLVAGRQKNEKDTVTIRLNELVGGTVDLRDVIYFNLDNGYVANKSLDDIQFEFEHFRPIRNDDNRIFEAEDDFGDEIDASEREGMEYILDLDRLYEAALDNGFIEDEEDLDWHSMLSSITFDLEIAASSRSEIGNINLEAESDNFLDGDITLLAGSVKNPFTIAMEPIRLDLGVKDQIVGEIVIKETAPEMLEDNTEIIIGIEGQHIIDANIKCDSTSDIDASIKTTDAGLLLITIKNESDDIPGEIIIDDLEFDIWAGTPQGKYDLFLSGSALDDTNDTYEEMLEAADEDNYDIKNEMVEYISDSDHTVNIREREYLTVGTELIAPQTIKTIVDFRNKSATVNGIHVHLTSEPYIVPSTWTSMIGVRDIATCFGVPSTHIAAYHDENDVMTVTIANGKMGEEGATIITVRDKSKILIVNGTPVIMAEPLTIGDDDRAYAPIRPIAEALGLEVTWDALSQRATFVN